MQKFPSIKAVRKALVKINKDVAGSAKEDDVEVRLQVLESGYWAVRFGSADYDQDHRGLWGSGYVRGDRRRLNCTDVARELLDQCRESYAEQQAFAAAVAPQVRVDLAAPRFPEIW
jgi:hypothetical protein